MNNGEFRSADADGPEPPPHLKFQRYQFAHVPGRFRKRSYRSQLSVAVPKKVEECHRLIGKLARRIYLPNGSVDVEDLVQIGEMVFCEQVAKLGASIIQKPTVALRILMEKVQWAMFHAIDQHQVSLPERSKDSTASSGEYLSELTADAGDKNVPITECNNTVARGKNGWDFIPSRYQSWGTPLPPTLCQPNPTSLCACARHLPLVLVGACAEKHPQQKTPPNPKAGGVHETETDYYAVVR